MPGGIGGPGGHGGRMGGPRRPRDHAGSHGSIGHGGGRGDMRGPGGPGMHGRGRFSNHGIPPHPHDRGFGSFGRFGGYRRPYRNNPGCLGGCLTFLLGAGSVIALIVLGIGALF